jgi:hypothetical protein
MHCLFHRLFHLQLFCGRIFLLFSQRSDFLDFNILSAAIVQNVSTGRLSISPVALRTYVFRMAVIPRAQFLNRQNRLDSGWRFEHYFHLAPLLAGKKI